jgi:serine/threonine protein kinase
VRIGGSGGAALSEESRGGSGEFAVGSLVAGYRLEEQIGRGGMAVVFRAYDARLDRHVALKILAPGLAQDDAFRQRFIRESRAAAAVDDPHIIPVFEAGEERGVLFIAMRFVRGGDVRSLLDRAGPLPPGRATEIISQVASALDAAHARGLVHRDVKPANMLLDAGQDDDRPDHVYLSDFGLTKTSLAATGLTSSGQFLGTLDYVAPEQIEGRGVDGRTDLYALACAAFELFTGEPPFRRAEGMAVMYAQVSEPAPLLSSRRQGLPATADQVMARALAKSPADRYPSCGDFAVGLRKAFGLGTDSGPLPQTPARPPTEIAAEPSWPRAAAGGAAAGGAAGGAGATGAGAAGAAGYPDRREPSPGGPPTRAASFPSGGSTRPGTEPPPGGSGGQGWSGDGGGAGGAGRPGRPWWRSPIPIAVIAVIVIVAAVGGYLALGRSNSNSNSNSNSAGTSGLTAPGCTTSTPRLKTLSKVGSQSVKVGGTPFAVRESRDGSYTFVTIDNGIAVLRNGGSVPTLVRTIPITDADKGLEITKDGRYLVAAGGRGAVVISVTEAEQGAANPVVGTLSSPLVNGKAANSAVGVKISSDGMFAFVTLQNSTKMAVFDLGKALSSGFGAADFVGFVPLGVQPVGLNESPDGKWLYATSFQRHPGPAPAPGTLSVINLHGAETKPATAVVSTVAAGCSPARIVTIGSTVWVTARDSNALLGFSASKLVHDSSHALIADVPVGPGPIGLTPVAGGKRIVVADSNLASSSHADGDLAVVSTSAALAGKPALLGVVAALGEPRQLTTAHGLLLVANQITAQLQAIKIADLP